MNYFKGSEVLEFCVKIEENGENFYRTIAKRSKDKSVKDTFLYLADEEIEHKKIFSKILKNIEDYKPDEAYTEEYFLYLKAYADNHVFSDTNTLKEKIDDIETAEEAIEFAIGFEKDSILYFTEMKNFVSDEDKLLVDEIINEERRHYRKLVALNILS